MVSTEVDAASPSPHPAAAELTSLLQHAIDEAARLLDADGAILYLIDAASQRLRWAYDAGISSETDRRWVRELRMAVGVGMFGTAVASRTLTVTDDYPVDQRFPHTPLADRVVEEVGIRSMVVAPLIAGEEALGAIGVYSVEPSAFGEADGGLIRALADHAAAAIANARLIEQLDHSRAELERQAEAERALREITARITALRDPTDLLQPVVDETKRLLVADGAHLSLMAASREYLTPIVLADDTNEEMRTWLKSRQFPVGGGINGLAASLNATITTADYLFDPRIPHQPDDQAVAERLRLRGMAAAPLRAPGGEVIGTLAVSYETPGEIADDHLALLQGLADQAAIAVVNARLYEGLRRSEERYRYLLQNSVDLIFAVDAAGTLTFLSPATSALTGWRPDELLGSPLDRLAHPSSVDDLHRTWSALEGDPDVEQRLRLDLRHRDGRAVPVELLALGSVADGRFAGAHGSLRDMQERDRLERDLRRQAAHLASAQERAHLARELHDSVTQALFSMTLTTRSIELLLESDPGAAADRIGELRELEREALAEMRSLIFELRPANLDDDGLVQALRTHAAAVQGRTAVPVIVDAEIGERVPRDVEHALYRIAQEALHNVVKHASASRVRILLRRAGETVELSVEDDGVGFDPAGVGGERLGLAGMRARAEQLGGRFTVEGALGRGTLIAVSVPVGDTVGTAGASAE